MRLKLLEVQGYKSFANKVEFVFDEGITAVVGPNGSGKSNVADAIRWVLGEQSYSTLRGKKTADMIFSGSEERSRMGMAAATLVLDNSDRWLPLDFSEVTISRRAYRSGENEYYLNGSRVRLRDVNEVLTKGGLSRQTYTVIGQGTVDRVLSLHAEERRQLFEEAAGIIFHRQKRADALTKLKTTQDNLLRLNDIVKEIEPRLRRLEKQAEKAREYELIKTHLEGLLRVWYGYRWRQAQTRLHEATLTLHESEAIVKEHRLRMERLTEQLTAARTEQTETRAQLSLWYSENNRLNKQAETVQRELAVSQERARQYAAQREEILAELGPLRANLSEQEERVEQAQTRLQTIEQELVQAETAMTQARNRLEAHRAELQALTARQTTAEEEARRLGTELTQRRTRLAQLQERRDTLQAEQETRAAEMERLQAQAAQLQTRQAELAERRTEFEGELLALDTEQVRQREALTELNRAAEQFKAELAALNRKEDALKARQDVLDKLRSDMSGYFAGVRAVLQSEAGLAGVIGTVSQVIEAPPELEVALEAALGGRLQDVVVDTFAHAEAAIAYLKRTRNGRATFLPLDTVRASSPIEVPTTPGVIGLATSLVSPVEERLQPIVGYALNRTVIVEDLPAARRAFQAMTGGFQIVTRQGELMRSGGSVTGGRSGGKRSQEGTFLAREREWRELPAQIEAVAAEQEKISAHLADNHDEAASLKQTLQTLQAEHRQKQELDQELQQVADEVSRSLEKVTASLTWQEDLQAKAAAELAQLAEREQAFEQEIDRLETEQQAAQAQAEQLARETEGLSAEKLRADLSQARADLAAVQAQHDNQQTLLANAQTNQRQLASQIQAKTARTETLAQQRESLLAQQQTLDARTAEFEAGLAGLNAKIQAAEKTLAELEARQLELEQEERNLRQRLQRAETEHNRLSLEAGRAQDELDRLQHQIHDDLGLVQLKMSEEQVGQPILPIQPLTDLPSVEELPAGVEEDVKRLKIQIRRLGSINPEAPREYEEVQERYGFLTAQISDLEAAVTDLRAVIAKLDQTMEEAFTETFKQVAAQFQHYFKLLFGGGEAQLLLTEPDNLIETGVDIVARPPGKRLQNLALLSGGERSLTAQALIFALLKISPTPFVIFDEVDAMLDEANVGRFRDVLVKLAQDIQFIIITHNRKTIEAADMLYGISMGDDSVSQAYSLKIEEWLDEDE